MHEDRDMTIADLRDRIARNEYEVDAVAVADAIVRRLRERAAARAAVDGPLPPEIAVPQRECSYPERFPAASTNVTPGGPSTTWPIHVSSSPLVHVALAASAVRRELLGMHAHSS